MGGIKYDPILGEAREHDGLSAADIALLATKEDKANKSTDVVADAASDVKYPSVKAVKTYVDNTVLGLLDFRGGYNASVNTRPATGGSGTAGAVMKGDLWIVTVAGVLGGTNVYVSDSLIAIVDTPGQTAGNWTVLEGNLSYVPENVANKVTSISAASTDTEYPSAKLLYDQLAIVSGSIKPLQYSRLCMS